jgi:hypothetical protein
MAFVVYLVVGLFGVVFAAFSLVGLESKAK